MILILLLVFLIPFFWNVYFSILSFIFLITLFSIILYLLGAYFLAFSLIIVYSGAIPILIVFLVKLISLPKINNFKFKTLLFNLFFFIKFFFLFSFIIDLQFWSNCNNLNILKISKYNLLDYFNINLYSKIGYYSIDLLYIKDFFYNIFFLYFFVSSLLLLISMIGSIFIIVYPISKSNN